jgi:hypothetical protein
MKTKKSRQVRVKKTKRPIHKRLLLHPLTVLLIIIVGVLTLDATFQSNAASYGVTATVPAAALTQPASITSLADNSKVATSPLAASGTCPANSYVKLFRNSGFSGVTFCATTGTFSITTDLTPGTNSLVVQDYNTTDQPGPASEKITVIYQPASSKPAAAGAQSTQEVANSPTSDNIPTRDDGGYGPLRLNAQFAYQAFHLGKQYQWSVELKGGTPPYFVTTNWGDGTTSELFFKTDPTFNIKHNYAKKGNYNIVVSSTDAKGYNAVFQLSARVVVDTIPSGLKGATTTFGKSSNIFSSSMSRLKHWLWIAWPSYLVVVLMMVSFWLGEREEYQNLLFRKNTRRTRTRRA